jgi:glycosyltransferase involved in cell wall biosynthesis
MSAARQIRIALVGPLPPPEGGMANQCRQLAALLSKDAVVEVVRTNAPYRPAWLGRIQVVRAFARLAPYLVHLWRAIGRADVVHVLANSGWNWHLVSAPAVVMSRWRRKPIIVNYRGGGAAEFMARAPKLVARTMARADALVVPSGFLQEVFDRHGLASRIVPNIIDLQRFHPAPAAPADRAHIVVTRNLEAIYDNATAIRALALLRSRIPHARLTLAGVGPERERLQALAESLGLTAAVVFAGRLANDAIAALYREADCMLNPSLVDNMPISVLEAFASGLPVVSTNVGGVPFIARDEGNALLVPPQNPAACAAALERVLSDKALAAKLTRAGLTDVGAYAWENVRSLWLAEYERAVAQASRHHEPTSTSNSGGEKASNPPPG